MYRETLMDQWKNLYSDFAGEYEHLQNQGNATAAFNRWYEARVHRWSSITYAEGILLEQEENEGFSKELQSVLKKFRFSNVKTEEEKPFWFGIVIGVITGIIAGAALMFLHWSRIKSVISGMALFIVIAAAFSAKNNDYKKQEQERVKESYIQQLRDYQNELSAVCDKYYVE